MKSAITILIAGICFAGLICFFSLQKPETNSTPPKIVWKQNYVLELPEGFNERKYILSHLALVPKPDVLVLGSSRIMLIDSKMFDNKLSFFGAGVSVATIPDFVAIWQHVKNLGKIPKTLIIYIDPWVFNENIGRDNWKINLDLYRQFFIESSETNTTKSPALQNNDSNNVQRLSAYSFVPENNLPPDKQGRRLDGSFIYPTELTKIKSQIEIEKKADEYLEGCVFCLCDWKFDENVYQTLVRLLIDIKKTGTQTLIVLPPYQHKVYKALNKRHPHKDILQEVTHALGVRLPKEPNISFHFCNALNPSDSGCSETEFMDGMHYLRSCSEKILKKCLMKLETPLSN